MRAPASSMIAGVAGPLHLHVGNVNDLFSPSDTIKGRSRPHADDGFAPPFLQVGLRRTMKRNVPKRIALDQEQVSEFGSANPHRAFQHGLENRFQFAGRA